jgi:hypothetical protein
LLSNVYLVVLTAQENGTLPRGPVETGPLWFAGARLAFSTFGIRAWSTSWPRPKFIAYFSRVLSKCQHYALACTFDAIGRLLEDGHKAIHVWADSGPHFRGYAFISSLSYWVLSNHRIDLQVSWGAEGHMKSEVDQFFGRIAQALEAARRERMVSTIAQLCEACRIWREHSEIADETFIDYLPPDRKDVLRLQYKISDFPVGIKSFHSITFRLTDTRRRELFGRNTKVLTAVLAKVELLPHIYVPYFSFVPEVEKDNRDVVPAAALPAVPPAAPAEESGDEVDFDDSTAVPYSCQKVRGWKTSYRQECPEEFDMENFKCRLASKRKTMQLIQHRVDFKGRHGGDA